MKTSGNDKKNEWEKFILFKKTLMEMIHLRFTYDFLKLFDEKHQKEIKNFIAVTL